MDTTRRLLLAGGVQKDLAVQLCVDEAKMNDVCRIICALSGYRPSDHCGYQLLRAVFAVLVEGYERTNLLEDTVTFLRETATYGFIPLDRVFARYYMVTSDNAEMIFGEDWNGPDVCHRILDDLERRHLRGGNLAGENGITWYERFRHQKKEDQIDAAERLLETLKALDSKVGYELFALVLLIELGALDKNGEN